MGELTVGAGAGEGTASATGDGAGSVVAVFSPQLINNRAMALPPKIHSSVFMVALPKCFSSE
uniref:Uncharacterized protein n=1 Tax=Desertifilum tharense IPPAS B-1220 TaxID=1781255 RepID=A0ACD5GPX2_9CYAN